MSLDDRTASRRKFLQFLAASPLLAGSDLAAWAASETPNLLPDPMLWGHRGLDRLITSPKEAINVFDFEPVMFKNVPPAHFGYMASGIDDEMTLRANREGFQKFFLRPRRLVDVRKVDMSVDILGTRYPTPDRPGAGRRTSHVRCRRANSIPPAAPRPAITCRSSRPPRPRPRGRDQSARRADLVPALCHQQLGCREGVRDARRTAPAVRWSP